MGIVVGYLATPEGRAALGAAIEEARQRDTRVVVVVSTRPDAPEEQRSALEAELDRVRAELASAGVDHEVRLLSGGDVADDLILTAEQVGAQLVVLGPAAAQPRRQAHPRRQRAAGAVRRPVPGAHRQARSR